MTTPVQISSWQDAERLAAAWMRDHGFPDARVTAGGADGGLDVVSHTALAQVKYQAAYVGRPALQRLVGARSLDHDKQLLFFTGSDYSTSAREYADAMDIALLTYTLNGQVRPVNEAAHRLARTAAAEDRTPPTFDRAEAWLDDRVGQLPKALEEKASQPLPPAARGLLLLGLGIFCLIGLVNGLRNGENFDDRGDIVPVLVFLPSLAAGAYFGLLGGWRRVRGW